MARQSKSHDRGGPVVVSSPDNPNIKLFRSLCRQNQGAAGRVAILEGFRAVLDAVDLGYVPELLLIGERAVNRLSELTDRGLRPVIVSDELFIKLAETQHPQGILAAVRVHDIAPALQDPRLSLVADQIRDPGNLGSMMRSTAAAGAHALYRTVGTVNPFNRKVVRAGMGAHLRLPVIDLIDSDDFQSLRNLHEQIVITTMTGDQTYDVIDYSQPTAIVIGGEAEGVGSQLLELADHRVRIPMEGDIESLNAGSVAAIVLFEAQRQRRKATAIVGQNPYKH